MAIIGGIHHFQTYPRGFLHGGYNVWGSICQNVASRVRKALRLPLGASYHGHGSEELTGWQVAMALVESTLAQRFFHVGLSENVGYIPNEIAIFHRDNDHENNWVQWGTLFFRHMSFFRENMGDVL